MLNKVSHEAGEAISPATSTRTKISQICVLGSHPATVAKAPFHDPSVLIYACSPDNSPYGHGEYAKELPRVDCWFEVHNPLFRNSLPYAYLDWLRTIPKVYMRDSVAMSFYTKDGRPLFPTAVPYPDEQMRGRKVIHPNGVVDFTPGEFHRSCFKSSIAFQMAKAIIDCEEQGIPSIALWGILQCPDYLKHQNKAGKNEFEIQRPSTQYFLEEAQRRGIDVSVSPESMLLHDDPELF